MAVLPDQRRVEHLQSEPGQDSRRRLRPEIQALRAVAVAAVVVYHLQPSWLPGGYIGVDVFFVISGFLISRHLVREVELTGRVDLGRFWAGRVRRILPAAAVTTVVVVAVSIALMPRTAAAEIGTTAVWAALSAANWWFASASTDYLAQSPDASPFEHFWSLGVEEQFYLVWPVLILLAAVIARRARMQVRSAVLVPVLVVVSGSLLFSIAFTFSGSPAAYFITPARAWELGAGGVLAVLLADRRLPRALAVAVQSAGMIAIMGAAALFSSATPMPGAAALVPVLGATAIIAGGAAPGLRRLWAVPLLQFLGAVSYSLYLWHWPVIVFTRTVLHHPLGPLSMAAVVMASLILATASYAFVEQPLRLGTSARPGRVIAMGLAASLLVAAVGLVPVGWSGLKSAEQAAARATVLRADGPAIGWPQLGAGGGPTWAREPHVVVPGPARLANDLAWARCTIQPLSTTSPICTGGDPAGRITIAVVGDSHARQWASSISRLAKARHWRLITLLHNSCPFSLVPRPLEVDGHSACTTAVRWALPVLRREGVSTVITSAYRKSYPASQAASAASGYDAMWRTLEADGIHVVVIGDTPTPMTDPIDRDCITQRDPATCGVPRRQATSVTDPLRIAAAKNKSVAFVDPTPALCTSNWCPGVIGNVGVYVDDNHVSNTYLNTAYPWFAPRLEAALGIAR